MRRVNSGNNRLSNRSCRSLSRGRRTVTAPVLIVSRRGLPYSFRYPCMSTAPRCPFRTAEKLGHFGDQRLLNLLLT